MAYPKSKPKPKKKRKAVDELLRNSRSTKQEVLK